MTGSKTWQCCRVRSGGAHAWISYPYLKQRPCAYSDRMDRGQHTTKSLNLEHPEKTLAGVACETTLEQDVPPAHSHLSLGILEAG